MSKLKRAIHKFVQARGWTLVPTANLPVSTMGRGLSWLAENGVQVSTVLDVGASDARWSKQCMNYFPQAQYVLFEPQPVHSPALDTFEASSRSNVTVVKKAVGAFEGETLFDASDPFVASLATRQAAGTISVPMTTLDAAISLGRLSPPYLLKLDTHGFERSILDGAAKTLELCTALVIEAYNFRLTQEAFLFWELCSHLVERRFRPIYLADPLYRTYDAALWQIDLFFLRSTSPAFEYLDFV